MRSDFPTMLKLDMWKLACSGTVWMEPLEAVPKNCLGQMGSSTGLKEKRRKCIF